MSGRGLIAESARGHRRGVVMGFTMAELMLLLLFCLLLATAGVLSQRDQRIAELEAIPRGDITTAELADLRQSDAQLNALLAMLGLPKLTPPQIDTLWRQLALANATAPSNAGAKVLAELTEEIGPLSAAERDRLLQAIAAMLASGMTARDMSRLAALTPEQLALMRQPGALQVSGHQWPPIISLDDNGNRFATGSAELTPGFRADLEQRVAGEVEKLLDAYGVDVIEIIGHTDEQVITPTRPSNLDVTAIPVMTGQLGAEAMVADDNAGLGLARAIAVARVLEATGRFDGIKLVPLSAAQLLLPGDALSPGATGRLEQNDQRRRRIEIRVRRSTTEAKH
jgi:flagellar motor protein MotB